MLGVDSARIPTVMAAAERWGHLIQWILWWNLDFDSLLISIEVPRLTRELSWAALVVLGAHRGVGPPPPENSTR